MNLEKDKIKWALLRELGFENEAGKFRELNRSKFVFGLLLVLSTGTLISVGLHFWLPKVFGWWIVLLGSLVGYGLAVYLGSKAKTSDFPDSHISREVQGQSDEESEIDSLFSSLESVCQQVYLGSVSLMGQEISQEAQILKVASSLVETLLDNGKTSQSELELKFSSQGVETSKVREAVDLLSSSDLLEVRSNGVEISPNKLALFI